MSKNRLSFSIYQSDDESGDETLKENMPKSLLKDFHTPASTSGRSFLSDLEISPMTVFSPLKSINTTHNLNRLRISNRRSSFSPKTLKKSQVKRQSPQTTPKNDKRQRRHSNVFSPTPIAFESILPKCIKFASKVNEIPFTNLCTFLSLSDTNRLLRVSKVWNAEIDRESVWRNIFTETSKVKLYPNSFSQKWKQMVKQTFKSSLDRWLSLNPSNLYLDIESHLQIDSYWTEQWVKSTMDSIEIIAGLELLPNFIWMLSKTSKGLVRNGFTLKSGQIVHEKGLDAFNAFIASIPSEILIRTNAKVITLLLVVFKALPENILAADLLESQVSVSVNPLRFKWYLPRDVLQLEHRSMQYFHSVPTSPVKPTVLQGEMENCSLNHLVLVLEGTWRIESRDASRRRSTGSRRSFGRLLSHRLESLTI